jgi:hypothetical protein
MGVSEPMEGGLVAFDSAGLNLRDAGVRAALLVVACILLALPIWLVKYPPLVDYPNHLARAFVLHHLQDPNYDFGRWFAPDWGPNPYLFADLLMQVFQSVVGIYAAGKLMLTLCVLGLPLSVLFFLRRANPQSEFLAIFAFAVAYNPDILMGFMSFQLSLALCFVVMGVWLDWAREGKTGTYVLLWMLTTLLYLTHLGGFAVAGLAVMLYTLVTAGIGKRLVMGVLPFAPGAALFGYAKLHGWAGRGLDYSTWQFMGKVKSMMIPLQGYSKTLGYVMALVVGATAVYFLARRNKLKVQMGWAAVAAALLLVHWAMPDQYGDLAFIDYRFCIFAFLFALAIPAFSGPRNWIVASGTALFLASTLVVGTHFAREQKRLTELANNFQYIPRNAHVLAYSAKGNTAWLDSDNLHFWSYGVIDDGWITPSLFHQKSVQPLQLRVPMCDDDDQYGDKLLNRQFSVESLRKDYDYIWASNIEYLDPLLGKIGEVVRSNGTLKIYKTDPEDGRTSSVQARAGWWRRVVWRVK